MIPRTSRQIHGSVVFSYYLINGLKMMYFAVAIFYTFFLELGLTFGQIALLYVSYGTASMVMNLPAPALTKKIGKKNISILAFTMLTIAIFEVAIANSFFTVALAFIMWGSADTLIYVAFESLFYENLLYLGIEDQYGEFRSQAISISTIFLIVSSITGPFLFMINPRMPWLLFGLALSVALVLVHKYPEFKNQELHKKDSDKGIKNTAKQSRTLNTLIENVKSITENAEIRKLILILLITTLSYSLFVENVEEPLLIKFGFSASALGIIYAITRGTTGILLPKIGKMSKKFGDASILTIATILIMASYMLILLKIPGFIFILISITIILAVNVNSLILEQKFQMALDSERRTMFMSLLNMISMTISNLGTFISSLVIENNGFEHYIRSATLVILIALSSGIITLYFKPNGQEYLIFNSEHPHLAPGSNYCLRNKDPTLFAIKEAWQYTKTIDAYKEKRTINHRVL